MNERDEYTEEAGELIDTEPEAAECRDSAEEVGNAQTDEYSLDGDMDELTEEYPELVSSIRNTSPERYSELRALGLSAKEAYLATGEKRRPQDTRSHLGDSTPRAARSPVSKMTRRELEIARSVFDGMSDDEIRRLYNRVKS